MCAINKYIFFIFTLLALSSSAVANEYVFFTDWNSSNHSSTGTFYVDNSTPTKKWNLTINNATPHATYYIQNTNSSIVIASTESTHQIATFLPLTLENNIYYKIFQTDYIQLKHQSPSSNTTMFKGRTQKYIVETNKSASVYWYINDTLVQYHTPQNSTYPQLLIDEFTTNNTIPAGVYNVTVVIKDEEYPTLYQYTVTWYTTVYDVVPSLLAFTFTAFFATIAYLHRRK